MKLRQTFLMLASVLGVFVAASSASAQYAPRYRPARPTLSPYLNLFRSDAGLLDNYNTFVRPQQQLRETLRRQDLMSQRQGAALNALGQRVTQQQDPALRPTGHQSSFMNYSHYYNVQRPTRRR